MRARVDLALLRRVADASRAGRFLLVNTTDIVDDGGMWCGTSVARRSARWRAATRTACRIMLASAGIPGAFLFREIDGSLYVDGGVTENILYGGRVREEQSFPALWATACLPVPTIRYWVIFNNQLRPLPGDGADLAGRGRAQPRNGRARPRSRPCGTCLRRRRSRG